MTFLYILRCCDDALYVGTTDDLTARLERHNRGAGCAFTARRTPVTLEHSEEFATRAEAITRERQVKGWTRAKKEALIAGNMDLLRRL